MAILFDKSTKIWSLQTDNTTYQLQLGEYGYLLHLYYGEKTQSDMSYMLARYDRGFSGNPYDAENDRTFSLDVLPQEYPCYGTGDYRTTCLQVKDAHGVYGSDLRVQSFEILKGKYALSNLPAVYAEEKDADTLKIVLEDARTKLQVTLLYGVLPHVDVITRAVIIKNQGDQELILAKAFSGCVDLLYGDYEVLHFHGRHGMERVLEKTPVFRGIQNYGSRRGTSSHQQNPFVIVADKAATEDAGRCYGMSLLYSGNFKCEIEQDQVGQIRAVMGVQDEMFEYSLKPGTEFVAPEVAYSYSGNGYSALSENFHRLIREHICRGIYKHVQRPILVNNWEATYFDFDGAKLVSIAKQAAELGVEMFVLDDGWFGARNSDNAGLGDWVVNEEKLAGPLSKVTKEIHDMGMKFGIWIEPEMVNEDSDLFRTHPDWAFTIPGKKPVRARNQLVLDFSRKEVVDHILGQLIKVFDSAQIEYVKMDMNRSISDVYTATENLQNQGEILYRYVLGVYDFLERLTARYPELLIEGCSGGGGRFDAGMLYYTPQIWCSDNTDAIDRIKIQHGTSFGYPISTMGAHVSAVPNHQTGGIVDIHTRGVVAMAGSFGYELDLNKITDAEKEVVKEQIKDCKKYWNLTHEGKYFRLTDPTVNREFAAWQFVSEDQRESLLNVVTMDNHCNAPINFVACRGLNEDMVYEFELDGKHLELQGSALMHGAIPMPAIPGEYQAFQIYMKAK